MPSVSSQVITDVYQPAEIPSQVSTIMVVDDNWVACEIVSAALGSRGHTVLVAPTGYAGMEMLSHSNVDLILLDLMLPDVDGAILIEQIRRLPGGQTIPILAFSAFVSRLEELQRKNAPFNAYVAKPVEPEHLIRIVEKHLVSKGNSDLPQLHTM